MKKFFNRCRKGRRIGFPRELAHSLLLLAAGLGLGLFAKWVDTVSLNSAVGWHRIFMWIDLRNLLSRPGIWAFMAACIAIYSHRPLRAVFNVWIFLTSMFVGYYLFTIFGAGFFPKNYMIVWYAIILITSACALLLWYARGDGWFAILMSALILGFMLTQSVSFGMWYIDVSYPIEFVCTLILLLLINKRDLSMVLTIAGGLAAAPVIKSILPYLIGGL